MGAEIDALAQKFDPSDLLDPDGRGKLNPLISEGRFVAVTWSIHLEPLKCPAQNSCKCKAFRSSAPCLYTTTTPLNRLGPMLIGVYANTILYGVSYIEGAHGRLHRV
jgi:hypothetical protein